VIVLVLSSLNPWYQRLELVVGAEQIEHLRNLHLMVVGLGSVGSFAAEALARMGVGELTLVDSDRVEPTNLNRQLVALHSTIGLTKAEVMAERVGNINPDCQVRPIIARVGPDYPDLLTGLPVDGLIDAIDSLDCKIWLLARCHALGIPVASAMGSVNRINSTRLKVA